MESWDSLLFLTDEYKAQWCNFRHETDLERERQCNEWDRQKKDWQELRLENEHQWREWDDKGAAAVLEPAQMDLSE